jgi:hypothetical protein
LAKAEFCHSTHPLSFLNVLTPVKIRVRFSKSRPEPAANKKKRSSQQQPGQMDFPLSQRGRDDAARIAQTFRKQAEVDEIYASPLLRADQTAEAFSNGEIWQVDY